MSNGNVLRNQVDFVLLVEAENANPNGDPLNDGRPRVSYDGRGEIEDVCIKRKIRNRFMQEGLSVFVQSDDNKVDEYSCLRDRYVATVDPDTTLPKDFRYEEACGLWLDVRLMGSLFAFGDGKGKKNKKDDDGKKEESVSLGIKGALSVCLAKTVAPVNIISSQITKSVNGMPGDGGRSSDTMGMKYRVEHGLYVVKGSVSSIQSEKNKVTEEDLAHLKNALMTLFVGDESAARPAGSMRVVRLYWFEHNGRGSAYKTHHSVKITVKQGVDVPKSFDDYDVEFTPVPGVQCEVVDL